MGLRYVSRPRTPFGGLLFGFMQGRENKLARQQLEQQNLLAGAREERAIQDQRWQAEDRDLRAGDRRRQFNFDEAAAATAQRDAGIKEAGAWSGLMVDASNADDPSDRPAIDAQVGIMSDAYGGMPEGFEEGLDQTFAANQVYQDAIHEAKSAEIRRQYGAEAAQGFRDMITELGGGDVTRAFQMPDKFFDAMIGYKAVLVSRGFSEEAAGEVIAPMMKMSKDWLDHTMKAANREKWHQDQVAARKKEFEKHFNTFFSGQMGGVQFSFTGADAGIKAANRDFAAKAYSTGMEILESSTVTGAEGWRIVRIMYNTRFDKILGKSAVGEMYREADLLSSERVRKWMGNRNSIQEAPPPPTEMSRAAPPKVIYDQDDGLYYTVSGDGSRAEDFDVISEAMARSYGYGQDQPATTGGRNKAQGGM